MKVITMPRLKIRSSVHLNAVIHHTTLFTLRWCQARDINCAFSLNTLVILKILSKIIRIKNSWFLKEGRDIRGLLLKLRRGHQILSYLRKCIQMRQMRYVPSTSMISWWRESPRISKIIRLFNLENLKFKIMSTVKATSSLTH